MREFTKSESLKRDILASDKRGRDSSDVPQETTLFGTVDRLATELRHARDIIETLNYRIRNDATKGEGQLDKCSEKPDLQQLLDEAIQIATDISRAVNSLAAKVGE